MKRKKSDDGTVTNAIVRVLCVTMAIAGMFFLGRLWINVQTLEKMKGSQTPPVSSAVPPVASDDHVKGEKTARIALIEYSDLECPNCKDFHLTAQKVVDTYDGRVMWVYRDFPLPMHGNALKEAEASECAGELGGNDTYWKYIDTIYERTTGNGSGFALDKLVPLAVELGLSETTFQDCLDSGKYAPKIQDEEDGGIKAGIGGTPGIILLDTKNGVTRQITGAVSYEQIKPVIDDMLK
ncbi:hypothetical protein A2Z00_00090 [Candidatus Gottesmanbacteria bacterium RBG_13_45_10]|uniref:Thioredoxin-like fold domain-containing protein n=1 Tax=Candidatus Gottesmanbacteria bacterium RBG_13_45_10 TaxID=1798370 RepID=A0A1F5ZGP8_9BACT|nr:MAG: hypothetical protein A2Z00_00090 [Candidatus Gottesmanbacteria bacterium RBG_13_45_10]